VWGGGGGGGGGEGNPFTKKLFQTLYQCMAPSGIREREGGKKKGMKRFGKRWDDVALPSGNSQRRGGKGGGRGRKKETMWLRAALLSFAYPGKTEGKKGERRKSDAFKLKPSSMVTLSTTPTYY